MAHEIVGNKIGILAWSCAVAEGSTNIEIRWLGAVSAGRVSGGRGGIGAGRRMY